MDRNSNDIIVYCGGADIIPIWEKRFFIDPAHTCCFTGHRPEKLPVGACFDRLLERTALFVRIIGEQGADTFITGMSRGFDLLAARAVLDDPTLSNVRIICAIPYRGHSREMRTREEKELYERIYRAAAAKVYFFNEYTKQCYSVRNSFMVNYSSRLLGYLRDTESMHTGTGQTINMAKHRGLSTVLITERELGEPQ